MYATARTGTPSSHHASHRGHRSLVVVSVLTTGLASDFTTSAVAHLDVDLGGIPGDRHWGLTRLSDARERHHPSGTIIRNRRQLSAVSVADCRAVAEALGIAELAPGVLGANLLLDDVFDAAVDDVVGDVVGEGASGQPERLSKLPCGTRLQAPSGATILVEEANPPCAKAGRAVAAAHPHVDDLARRFVTAARHLRGIVASVESAGPIHAGDRLTVLAP